MRWFTPLFALLSACDGASLPADLATGAVDSAAPSLATASSPSGEVGSTEAPTTPAVTAPAPGSGATYQSGTVIELSTGAVAGREEGGLRVFRGIPYAAPPVGSLRLRDPQPVAPWQGVLEAAEFGPACPQSTVSVVDWLSQTDDTDEDCLTLNVWAHDDGTAKPVMVWLHGGAFFYGAGSQDLYDATAMALEDVVVVSVNYRLGALGFLAHPDLGAQVGNDNPGNYGLKDQVAALQWVQEHIAAFGGDPDNVTVFGESAGAISTCILATLPATDGLMHKAIGQSIVGCHALPTATTAGAIGGVPPIEQARDAVAELGCEGAADLLACLQDAPVDDFVGLVNATDLLTGGASASFPMPYIDGSFVPEAPQDVYARGEADIPMIVGTNQDESTMFLALSAPLTWFDVDEAVTDVLGTDAYTDDVLELYTLWDYPFPQDAYLTFATDALFSCPNLALADAQSSGAPVYLYEFQEHSLTTLALGSHHALELPYVFGTYSSLGILFPTASDLALGDAMRGAWADFAHDSDPGWPAWQAGGEWMRFDDRWGTMPEAAFRDGRCDGLADAGLGLLEVH